MPLVTMNIVSSTLGTVAATTVAVPPADALAIAMTGTSAGRSARAAERTLAGFDADRPLQPGSRAWNAIRALIAAESDDAALHILDRVSETAHERGTPFDVHAVRVLRCDYHLGVGELEAAEADARALHAAADRFDWPAGQAWAAALLCEVLVARGDLAEADGLFAAGPLAGPATLVRSVEPAVRLLVARGGLRRAQGRTADALADLREAGRRASAVGALNPALVPWRSELALTDPGAGDAHGLAQQELALARRFGAPRATARALRATARVTGGEAATVLLHEAIDTLDGTRAPVERGRVLADLGVALLHLGAAAEARDALRVAVHLAHQTGAHALEAKALADLRAAGARPRRLALTGAAALTRSERRVADLAAAGHQNRQIADELVVTLHTVEFHLRNAYRKLGIKSRSALPAALAPPAAEHDDYPAVALAA